MAAAQPLKHGDAAELVDVPRAAVCLQDVEHGPGDGELVFERQRRELCERTHHVKWRGEQAGLHFTAAPLRIEEHQAVEKFDFVGRTYATVKVFKICAAAQGDMLAVVDVFAVSQDVGGCASPEEGPLL